MHIFGRFACATLLFLSLNLNATARHPQLAPPLPVGDTISSPTTCYTVDRELGTGAFGQVYAVTDSNGDHYAMKMIDPDWSIWLQHNYYHSDSSESSQRPAPTHHTSHKSTNTHYTDYYTFDRLLADGLREYLNGLVLDHPNIIKSFEFFTTESSRGTCREHLILELVDGETLRNTPHGSFHLDQALVACLQFLDAFDYALEREMILVDGHGGNLMLTREGTLKIIDLASFITLDEFNRISIYHEQKERANSEAKARSDSADAPQSSTNRAAALIPIPRAVAATSKHRHNGIDTRGKARLEARFIAHTVAAEPFDAISLSITDRMESFEKFGPDLFTNIVYLCGEIIETSDLDAKGQAALMAPMLKLIEDYKAEAAAGAEVTFSSYIEELADILEAALLESPQLAVDAA